MTEQELFELSRHTLRIKIKYLAEEARIIRKEEVKTKSSLVRLNLRLHRLDIVRYEQRHSLLAYAFIRGIPYKKIENKSYEPPRISKILKILANHAKHLNATEKDLINWLT